ncbi:MAG: hypothetical protein NTY63_09665 [Candidatus Bipolaricaulota bacterium]|nr:hypothetical protein [Candidatus Bipolaricaulota bacterium]
MKQFDVLEEQERLERRREEKPRTKSKEKPRVIGLGVIALFVLGIGVGIGEETGYYAASVVGCLAAIFVAMIAVDNHDTKGTAVTTIVLAAIYLVYTLSGRVQAIR